MQQQQEGDAVKRVLAAKREQLAQGLDVLAKAEVPDKPLPHELEMQRKKELLARVRERRARLLVNKGRVEGGDPKKVYVWINQRDERRTYFEGLGYTLCKDPHVKTQWGREDGTHHRGDLILYEIDRDTHEALKLDSQIRAVEQMASSRESFREFAAGSGIKTFSPGG